MIRFFFNLYCLLIIFDTIMSYFHWGQQFEWRRILHRIVGWSTEPLKRKLPPMGSFDFTPGLVILIIQLIILLW